MTATRRKLDKMVKRNTELSVLFKRLYADNVLGKISIPSLEMVVQQMAAQTQVPSIDKGRHGFDGQKCAHTASSPLTIRQVFSAGLSLSGHISAPAKLPAPASDGSSSDFWLLRRRRAGARQGEKGEKRRKDTLAGVFALVNRWYRKHRRARRKKEQAGSGVSRCLPIQKVRSLCVPVKDARIRRLFFCLRFRCTGAFPRWPRPRRR